MLNAVEVIHNEHVDLDKVLGAIETAVNKLSNQGKKPSLDLLTSAIYYIRIFPDKLHHPKEEAYLFKALKTKKPECGATLDELKKQHAEGSILIQVFDEALRSFDASFPEGLPELKKAAHDYVQFQRAHIGMEEREILPLARKTLDESDWNEVNHAFSSNFDPLFGENIEAGFHALFQHITGQNSSATKKMDPPK